MNSRYKYLIKNTGILTISNFSSKFLSFLMVPLYTSVLSTEEYGQYDIVMSSIQLILPIFSLNIVDGVMRFLMDSKINKDSVISVGVNYVVISIMLSIVTILSIGYLANIKFIRDHIILIILLAVSFITYQFMIQSAKGLEKVLEIGIAGVIGTVVTIGCNILFLIIFPLGIDGFYLSYILGMSIPALYIALHIPLVRQFTYMPDHELAKEMLIYSLPLILTAVGWWVITLSGRYFVTSMCGMGENGIYSVSSKIPGIIVVIQGVFLQAWQITAVKEAKAKDADRFYTKAFLYLNILMVISSSIIIFFTNHLAQFMYAKEFYTAWQYVPFLIVSTIFNCAAGYIGAILSAQKNSQAMGMSAIYGVVSSVVFNAVLISLYGVQGAALSAALSSFVIFFVRYTYVKAILKGQLIAPIVIGWGVVIIQSFIRIQLGFNLFELFCICIILLLYKKQIINSMIIAVSKICNKI